MNIGQVAVFWNLLISGFGLSILEPRKNNVFSWQIHKGKVLWSILLTVLFAALSYFQVTHQIYHRNVFSPEMILFLYLGENVVINLIRIALIINTKILRQLYESIIEFDSKYFCTKVTICKSRTFMTLVGICTILTAYVVFDLASVGHREGYLLILEAYIYPAYEAVLLGQMAIFLSWIRNSLTQTKNKYLLTLKSRSTYGDESKIYFSVNVVERIQFEVGKN